MGNWLQFVALHWIGKFVLRVFDRLVGCEGGGQGQDHVHLQISYY